MLRKEETTRIIDTDGSDRTVGDDMSMEVMNTLADGALCPTISYEVRDARIPHTHEETGVPSLPQSQLVELVGREVRDRDDMPQRDDQDMVVGVWSPRHHDAKIYPRLYGRLDGLAKRTASDGLEVLGIGYRHRMEKMDDDSIYKNPSPSKRRGGIGEKRLVAETADRESIGSIVAIRNSTNTANT